jgi:hypothetical protein
MIVFIPLALVLSYYYSFQGTCIAIMLAELITSALNAFYSRKIDNSLKLFSLKDIIHSIIGSLLFIPIVYLFDGMIMDKIIKILVVVAGCTMIYFFWMAIIRNRTMLALLSEIRSSRAKAK